MCYTFVQRIIACVYVVILGHNTYKNIPALINQSALMFSLELFIGHNVFVTVMVEDSVNTQEAKVS